MGIVESVKNIFESKEKEIELKKYVTAIVVAAGNATRMRHSQGKLFINLCGMPILARTLLAFDESQKIDEVIVVARQDDILQISDMVNDYDIKKVNHIVKGGETRQQSVICGMKELNPLTEYIVIHDGARPLILPQTIDKTVLMAMEHQAAATGVRVKDTLKTVDEDGFISSTPPRSSLWSVQTPQVFEIKVYRAAIEAARIDNVDLTDDCQLVERLNFPVFMVEGDYSNIKITTQEDIYIAETILSSTY